MHVIHSSTWLGNSIAQYNLDQSTVPLTCDHSKTPLILVSILFLIVLEVEEVFPNSWILEVFIPQSFTWALLGNRNVHQVLNCLCHNSVQMYISSLRVCSWLFGHYSINLKQSLATFHTLPPSAVNTKFWENSFAACPSYLTIPSVTTRTVVCPGIAWSEDQNWLVYIRLIMNCLSCFYYIICS